MNAMEEIKILWEEFLELPFPHGSRTKDLTVDLALNDGGVAGCIQTFVENGTLDEERIRSLRNCINGLRELRARCAKDDSRQKARIAQLLTLSEKVLQAVKI